ncbi:unnamed protein product [Paramecium pentaurelia]|uniref:Uncharacterized protein n=1 Tax=Paramecium pentaurelia TaxID=43138 RepID=A0A8S1WC01_9CILI|nr:unnamed protein product [Paramecium pentaurelia]
MMKKVNKMKQIHQIIQEMLKNQIKLSEILFHQQRLKLQHNHNSLIKIQEVSIINLKFKLKIKNHNQTLIQILTFINNPLYYLRYNRTNQIHQKLIIRKLMKSHLKDLLLKKINRI